jgi:hypothetical protein
MNSAEPDNPFNLLKNSLAVSIKGEHEDMANAKDHGIALIYKLKLQIIKSAYAACN